jgi:hypothetical protein
VETQEQLFSTVMMISSVISLTTASTDFGTKDKLLSLIQSTVELTTSLARQETKSASRSALQLLQSTLVIVPADQQVFLLNLISQTPTQLSHGLLHPTLVDGQFSVAKSSSKRMNSE